MGEHVIYKITNTVNNKIYIGQTKKYYGKRKFGANGRLKVHINSALNNTDKDKKSGCPKLCNAIRKYGKNNFVIEELEAIDVGNVDDREMYYIKFYDSTSDKGYNIALGGNGRKVANVTEEARKNISKAQVGEKEEMNIRPYKDKKTGEIIGYRARCREHDRYVEKHFTSKKNTPDENRKLALEFIESVKNNTEDKYEKYNKKSVLPRNISYAYSKKDKTKIIGYQLSVCKNGKKFTNLSN